MYTMTPFEKKHFDLLNAFHDFENDFFAGTGWSTCKVDVRDEGDKFVMEAELPGFEKEDIHLDVQGDCLKLSAEHHAASEKSAACAAGVGCCGSDGSDLLRKQCGTVSE